MSIELFGCTPGPYNALMDVPGLGVGHAICEGGQGDSGVTVIAAPGGALASVDVRGGGPGTRETDLLAPANTVQAVHAVALCGGSSFGLDAAAGSMSELESRGIGFPVLGPEHPENVVPIVPAAVIFDLLLGRWDSRPDQATGRAATAAALEAAQERGSAEALRESGALASGNVGAGLGAAAGALKGGVGQASAVFPAGGPLGGVVVSALVVANPQGGVFDPRTGQPWALAAELGDEFRGYPLGDGDGVGRGAVATLKNMNLMGTKITEEQLNTTIGVVATTAALDKAQAQRVAMSSHDGLARAIRPAHMPMDGDTLFTLATGEDDRAVGPKEMSMISAVAANVVERAIGHAVLAATGTFGVPSWQEVVAGDGHTED
ncbi:MAG TPA: P1 family peptidase [Candidatus Corynebacterium gallistercoris]|uniref:P1 family peptidase n=1 Tax=Candidatus Corynebacterium gallistercoris TaxID=2838530 RepID=A0A9D1RYB0_9CORY|nr:P1 family peptidase [Candidatus Corynebacterium gallistercoris]